MNTSDFEKKIQDEIDATLNIRVNPNATDIAGVYWGDIYLGVAVPPTEIRDEVDQGYQDKVGQPYKSIPLAEDFIKGKLTKFKKALAEDPDLFE